MFKNILRHTPKTAISIFILLSISLVSCSIVSTLIEPVERGDWRSKVWEELREEIREERKGLFNDKGLFGELDLMIKEKIDTPPVFAENVKGGASDEIYLLFPRNTAIRGSLWDGTFRWNWAVGGSNYVFHLFKDGVEIFEAPRRGKRTINLKKSVKFVPGVVYTWDVTCCVEICNLPLSSNAFNRPEFLFLTPAEERTVEREIDEVSRRSAIKGIEGSPTDIALSSLVLERHKLYLEEVDLLLGEIEKHPDSALLHLVLSSVYDHIGSPSMARKQYGRARELSNEESNGSL